jgi:hypothetical protein
MSADIDKGLGDMGTPGPGVVGLDLLRPRPALGLRTDRRQRFCRKRAAIDSGLGATTQSASWRVTGAMCRVGCGTGVEVYQWFVLSPVD